MLAYQRKCCPNEACVSSWQQLRHAHALLTCIAGFTGALVAVDFVDARAKVAWIALAVVNVDFAVGSFGRKALQSDMQKLNRKNKKTFSLWPQV